MPPVPNLFSFVPNNSLNVVEIIYWICAWAHPNHHEVSEDLNRAGARMLEWLFVEFGVEWVDEISHVEMVRHLTIHGNICYLRVNHSHALSLYGYLDPDVGFRDEAYWGSKETKLLAVCCEELPCVWQRVDSGNYVCWKSRDKTRVLSLHTLTKSPLFETSCRSAHGVIGEFCNALENWLTKHPGFEKQPPETWDQWDWSQYYLRLKDHLPGELFMKPYGEQRHPFCRLEIPMQGSLLILTDWDLRIKISDKNESRHIRYAEIDYMCIQEETNQLDLKGINKLIYGYPYMDEVTIMPDHTIRHVDDLVDTDKTIDFVRSIHEYFDVDLRIRFKS